MPPPSAADCTKLFPRDKDRNRFMKFVVQEPAPTLCWRWTGHVAGRYPLFDYLGEQVSAARWAYRSDPRTPPIPLDRRMLRRRCKNALCVNPEHLDPVDDLDNAYLGLSPSATNVRKRFCPEGHELAPENTKIEMVKGRPRRRCIECRRVKQAESERRRRMRVPCGDCGELCKTGQCRQCLLARFRARREARLAERAMRRLTNSKPPASPSHCTKHDVDRVRDARGRLRCPACQKVWNSRKRELDPHRYRTLKEKGRCVRCGQPRGDRPYRCDRCHELHNEASRASRRARAAALREDVSQAAGYSGLR